MTKTRITELDAEIARYETAVAGVGGPRLSYLVDADIITAVLRVGVELKTFASSTPDLERPTLVDAPRGIRGPEDGVARETFVAIHQANIAALKAFRELAEGTSE